MTTEAITKLYREIALNLIPDHASRAMEIYRESTPWWQRMLYKLLPPDWFPPRERRRRLKHIVKAVWRNLFGHPQETFVSGVAPAQSKEEDEALPDGLYICESLDNDDQPIGPASIVDQDGNLVVLPFAKR